MSEFRRTVPNQEVKLRKWPPGRVNQLRSFLSHMSTAMDNSLAAQVIQTGKRKFSEFLPKVTTHDITVEVNYREIRLIFTPPRGLRKFLFYEMEVSRFPNFNNFDRFQSPEPVFVFTALEPGIVYYFRIRVVSTEGEVGPWSETITQQALNARASSVFDNRLKGLALNEGSNSASGIGTYRDCLTIEHQAIGGILFYMVNFEIRIPTLFAPSYNLLWGDTEFRWTENGNQIGDSFAVTSYGVNTIRTTIPTLDGVTILNNSISGTINKGAFTLPGPFSTVRSGTFCQKLHRVTVGPITIKLQARVYYRYPTRGDWRPTLDANSAIRLNSGVTGRFRNASSFEYIVDS